jgi:hypothetical protein
MNGRENIMKDDITGLIICGFIFLLMLSISLVLRSGRGSFLISGYNLLSKEEKAKYNTKILCRYVGNLLLVIDFLLIPVVIAGIYEITWIIITIIIAIVVISIGGIIYINSNSRFKIK